MSDSIIVNVNPASTDLVVINSNEETTNQIIQVDDNSLSTSVNIQPNGSQNVTILTDDITIDKDVNINQGGDVFSVNGKIGHVILTKNDFGLSAVNNTADLDKPISYLTLSALALKADWSYVSEITSVQDVFYKKVADQVRDTTPVNFLVNQASAQWNDAYGNLVATSAFYLGISGASKQSWDSVYSTTFTNSSFWTDAYTNLISNSAFYFEGGKSDTKFLAISGGNLKGKLTITDNISTKFVNDNSLFKVDGSVTLGKDLSSYGENNFVAGSNLVLNGINSWGIRLSPENNILNKTSNHQFFVSAAGGVFLQGNVGIGIENYLTDKLLVAGSIRTTDIFYDKNGNSDLWNSVYSYINQTSSNEQDQQEVVSFILTNSSNIVNVNTKVNNTSANWDSIYSSWNSVSGLDLNVRSFVNSNSSNVVNVNTKVNTTSANWDSVYSSWNSNSSLDLNVRTYVNSNSSNINNVLTRVNTTSANWNSVYNAWNSVSSLDLNVRTYVNSNSSNINNVLTRVNTTSANWNSIYNAWNNVSSLDLNVRTYVNSNSSNIDNVLTIVNTTSANWNSIYNAWNSVSSLDLNVRSIVNSNSANWNSVYSYVNQASGAEQDQQEVVSFILTNSSNIVNVNTKVNTTSANWDSVYSSWNKNSSLELEATSFVNSNSSNVVNVNTKVNTTSANWDSIYNAWNNVSGLDLNVRTYVNSNSSNINNVLTKVNSSSANWSSVYSAWNNVSSFDLNVRTYVNSNSSNINNVLTRVNTTSANWNSVYSAWNNVSSLDLNVRTYVNSNSSNINNVNTKVNTTSGNWDSVYSSWNSNSAAVVAAETFVENNSANIINVNTKVNTTSADWDSVYSSVCIFSANWNDVYSYVNSVSTKFESGYVTLCAISANSESSYSVLCSLSGNWDSVYSQVLSNSSFWQETYITVQNNGGTVWNYQGTDLKELSGRWESTYSSWNSNSADLIDVENFVRNTSASNSVFNTVCALSSNWNSVYSTVCSTSSTFATILFSDSKYIPLTSIDKQLNANSTNTVTNSAVTNRILQIENSLNILVPAPTYTAPAATLTTFSPAIFEVGQTVTASLTLGYTQNDGGTATFYRLEKNSSLVQEQATAFTRSINETAVLGLTRYTCIVTHLSGAVKNNAIGLPDARGVITAGTKSINRDYNSYYRQFHGSVNALPTSPSLVRNLTGLTFTTTNSFTFYVYTRNIAIAIPSSRQLVSIITGSFENLTTQFNLSSTQVPDAAGTPRDYKLYTYTTVNPYNSNFTITLS